MAKRVKVDGRIITVPDDATPDEIDAISQTPEDVEEPAGMSTGEKISTVAKSAWDRVNPIGMVKGMGDFAMESFKENPLFPLKTAAEKFTLAQAGNYDRFMDAMGANSDAGLTTKAAGALSTIPILGSMMVSGAKRVSSDEKTSLEGLGELIGDATLTALPFAPKGINTVAHGAGKALQSSGVQSAVAAGMGYGTGGPLGGYLGYMLRRKLLSPPMNAAGRGLEKVNLQWPDLSKHIAPRMGATAPVRGQITSNLDELPAPAVNWEQWDRLSKPVPGNAAGPIIPALENIDELPAWQMPNVAPRTAPATPELAPSVIDWERLHKLSNPPPAGSGAAPIIIDDLAELPPLPRVGGGSPLTPENVPEFPIKYRIKSRKTMEPVKVEDMYPEGISREAGTSSRDLGTNPRAIDKLPDNVRKALDEKGSIEIVKKGDEVSIYDSEGNDITKAIGSGAKSTDGPVVTPGMSLRERGINPRRIKELPDAVRKFVEKNREDLMAIKEDGDDFVIHMRKDGKDFTKRMNAVGNEPKAASVASEKPPIRDDAPNPYSKEGSQFRKWMREKGYSTSESSQTGFVKGGKPDKDGIPQWDRMTRDEVNSLYDEYNNPSATHSKDMGGVSPEELSRPGTFYKMGKSGEPTYLGKKVDAGNLKEGEAIIRVSEGSMEPTIYQGSGSNETLKRFKKWQDDLRFGKAQPAKDIMDEQPTIKRAADFDDSHNYDVEVQGQTHKIYRDPESSWWYLESSSPLIADKHFSRRVLGFTKQEALNKLTKLVDKEGKK